ncbi:hypothetical protein [Methylobacterium soli]|uniref:Uncharacterized protein n=1 Tax=Methylobacterium soli TaxID=553447 RepID=A0A6L3SPZ6_9HYPH|nr:hypothetical protein [Methylobacterium soli]KAB1072381.1 hypothetical protein F6X53_28260 [Methylobacterium soli]
MILANRRNARASTGPRTAEGKARSAQNARRHGLAAAASDPQAEIEAEHLAALLAGDLASDPAILEAARAVAEAQSHLQRVRAVKIALMRDADSPESPTSAETLSTPLAPSELLQGLERLARYERRALSLRKSAVRRLETLALEARRLLPETASQ